jgi:L-methionine (R)-S-oxide reductase
MAEELHIPQGTKTATYAALLPQVKALVAGEPDLIANLSNVCAALHSTFHFFWVGFYLVKEETLVLGPFQGPIACTRIAKGKGVCGTAWLNESSILVPDVEAFPGHIACSSESKSELVIPIFQNKRVVAVLDIDSKQLNDFDEIDEQQLNELCTWLGNSCF